MIQRKATAYQDGIVEIYAVKNIAPPGGKPVDGLTMRCRLRYEERTLGMGRYYAALQNQVELSRVIRCPRLGAVRAHDVAVIGGKQYSINLIQYPFDAQPPSMDLSLEGVEHAYEFEQNSGRPADGNG